MAAPKKVMDVSKPGKTPPSATARPVIVGHGPRAQDPMMAPKPGTDDDDDAKPAAAPMLAGKGKTIQPLASAAADSAKEADTVPTEKGDAAEPKKAADDEPAAKPAADAEPAKSDAPAESSSSIPADEAELETEEDKDAAVAAQKKKQEEAEQAKAEQIEKLITEKRYFVKISEVKRKRTNTVAFIVLLVLVLAGGAYYAVDAGIVKTSIKLPVHVAPQ